MAKHILISENKIAGISENRYEVHESMKWIEGPDNVDETWLYDSTNNTVIPRPKETVDHQFARMHTYPSVEEQLGLLFKDIENGVFGETAKTGEFYKLIKGIKEDLPKGTPVTEEKLSTTIEKYNSNL